MVGYGMASCIDYRKLNDATRKDHFPLPFMDQILERLAGNEYYCFLDDLLLGYFISKYHDDQEKTNLHQPLLDIAYRRMPFVILSPPPSHLDKMLQSVKHNLVQNCGKFHFMVKEGISP
ncbi:hypothetical protein Tco_0427876 [Tanacetum coccineum]